MTPTTLSTSSNDFGEYLGKTTIQRFWEKVAIGNENDCWNWTGSKDQSGYGRFVTRSRKSWHSHRFAWVILNGAIWDTSLYVLHKCDNPSCCNPNHLFLGTQSVNIQDAVSKSRWTPLLGEDHGMARLSDEQVVEIREKYDSGHYDQACLSHFYRVTKNMISKIVTGRNWKHVGGPIDLSRMRTKSHD